MMSISPEYDIEVRVRREFQDSLDELERAPVEQKAEAAERLNIAMRRLYDFVAYGKVPADLQFKRSAANG